MTNAKVESPKERNIIYIGPFNDLNEAIQIRASPDFDTWLHQNQLLIRRFDAPTLRSCYLTTIRMNGIEPMISGYVVEID